MAGELIANDWEIEFQGLLMGGDTNYSVSAINGLLDLPDLVTSDQGRLHVHGIQGGEDFLGGRSINLTLEVYGVDETSFESVIQTLLTALQPGKEESPLVFQIPTLAGGEKIRVNARARRRSWPITLEHYYYNPTVEIEFFCSDPRIYSNGLVSSFTGQAISFGGLEFDATPNFTFGVTGQGGNMSLENSGSFPAPVVFRIDGPIQNPRIIHEGLGKEIGLNLAITAGSFVIVDTGSRTILLEGTASRYSSLTRSSEWFNLEPGANPLKFRGTTPTNGYIYASWRSAWV